MTNKHDADIARSRAKRVAKALDTFGTLGNHAINGLVVVAVFYFLSTTVQGVAGALAGKATSINSNLMSKVDWAIRVGTDRWIAYLIAFVMSILWGKEKRLRKKVVKKFAPAEKARQLQIDPERSSSGLDASGDPPKGRL